MYVVHRTPERPNEIDDLEDVLIFTAYACCPARAAAPVSAHMHPGGLPGGSLSDMQPSQSGTFGLLFRCNLKSEVLLQRPAPVLERFSHSCRPCLFSRICLASRDCVIHSTAETAHIVRQAALLPILLIRNIHKQHQTRLVHETRNHPHAQPAHTQHPAEILAVNQDARERLGPLLAHLRARMGPHALLAALDLRRVQLRVHEPGPGARDGEGVSLEAESQRAVHVSAEGEFGGCGVGGSAGGEGEAGEALGDGFYLGEGREVDVDVWFLDAGLVEAVDGGHGEYFDGDVLRDEGFALAGDGGGGGGEVVGVEVEVAEFVVAAGDEG